MISYKLEDQHISLKPLLNKSNCPKQKSWPLKIFSPQWSVKKINQCHKFALVPHLSLLFLWKKFSRNLTQKVLFNIDSCFMLLTLGLVKTGSSFKHFYDRSNVVWRVSFRRLETSRNSLYKPIFHPIIPIYDHKLFESLIFFSFLEIMRRVKSYIRARCMHF